VIGKKRQGSLLRVGHLLLAAAAAVEIKAHLPAGKGRQ
jgi:hypothetical protein